MVCSRAPIGHPAPLAGEFEVVIMIAGAIEETDGSDCLVLLSACLSVLETELETGELLDEDFQQCRGYIASSVIISRCSDTVRCKSRAKFE